MEIIRLDSTDSTNNWASAHEHELPPIALVCCHEQTAGRGQRGNVWESQPGKNITASLIFHPQEFPADQQFHISETVALAIVDFLKSYGVNAQIKWPNDIYVGDKKICGILVEHVVSGRNITRSIAGFGININQTRFLSDAPNPVSLTQITGKDHDLDAAIHCIASILEKRLQSLNDKNSLHQEFLNSLWRKDGAYYNFFDRKNNEQINASIQTVEPSGLLHLQTRNGETRTYSFKEVEYL
ncbi:MAG: biotin--[acetyl-CoA-carboxylase] ligase [Muribaculaceae bacterium]|nr:biotin--[acetyl-CoA-carboxylase] ligase [Muribaculaceae bacterium]